MSGLIACAGEWLPIPVQLVSLVASIVNNVIPGLFDAWGALAKFLTSIMDAIMVFGK